jgi:hypothetical protein
MGSGLGWPSKPWHALDGQEILCIGCLEKRIGRTLMSSDFTDAPINDPNDPDISDRLRDRLTTKEVAIHGFDGLLLWMTERMIKDLPPNERVAARASARAILDRGGTESVSRDRFSTTSRAVMQRFFVL